jgi:hypothetical protein
MRPMSGSLGTTLRPLTIAEAVFTAARPLGLNRTNHDESRERRGPGWLPEANGVEGYLELGITWLQNEVTALLAGGNPPIPLADSAATALETAFLLFTANSPSEIDTAELIRGPSPSNVTVTVLPNVDHAQHRRRK